MAKNHFDQPFRTIVQIEGYPQKVNYDTKSFLIGSCFAENIGDKLNYYKFPNLVNPFGILYNPFSISKAIEFILNKKKFKERDFFYHDERYQTFHFHGRISSLSLVELLKNVNDTTRLCHEYLKKSNFLIITLGTAWVYALKENNQIVANCHKVLPDKFSLEILPLRRIISLLQKMLQGIFELNKGLNVVMTVSPIRHWKNGPVNNQYSKASLILAIHEIIKKFPNVHYFPAYEIMMDDLRGYRFYERDMIHPNSQAIEYIWHKFLNSFIDPESMPIMKRIEKIQQAKLHRPFKANSKLHLEFKARELAKVINLKKEHPELDLEDEINFFQN